MYCFNNCFPLRTSLEDDNRSFDELTIVGKDVVISMHNTIKRVMAKSRKSLISRSTLTVSTALPLEGKSQNQTEVIICVRDRILLNVPFRVRTK